MWTCDGPVYSAPDRGFVRSLSHQPFARVYTEFFNLREMPFTITPDPSYLYLSSRHQEALGHLLYGTGQYGGFVQLTGEVGTGKTTIVRTLMAQKLVDVDVAMIHNPRQTEIEFVQSICDELGVQYPRSDLTLKTLVDALNAHLLAVHQSGRRTVVIIDEAQNLPRDTLEQVRLLTNLETHKEKLLRIMLIGQPELSELLARPDLRQLASRITARYHLMPLTAAETGEYIRHRLRVAGSNDEVFPPAAIAEIHRFSRGVPRLINILCDRSLLGAYSQGLRRVTAQTVGKSAAESLGTPPPSEARHTPAPRLAWLPRSRLAIAELVLTVLALVIAAALLYRTFADNSPAPAAARPAATPAVESAPAEASPPPEQARPDSNASTEPAPTAKLAAETSAPADTAKVTAKASGDLTTLLQASQPLPSVMGRLIRLWDANLVLTKGANVCSDLATHDLECFKAKGEWADLRTMNRPAVLSLTTGRGETQHVLLRRLSATVATIDSPHGALELPLEQIDALWTGEFLLLWKRETPENYLAPGAKGPSVVWLRNRLGDLLKQPPRAPLSDRFDDALARQLRQYQTRRGLESDGVVGQRTLIALGESDPETPVLGAVMK